MRSTLVNLGFTKIEAEVYILLAASSPQTARDITIALDLCSSQIYRVLQRLHCNGAIVVSSERPNRYSAVVFEKVLELLIDAKKEQHDDLLARKKELLFTWKSIIEK
jgi:sugar-specific transcriptional regulator TrmB